MLIGCPIASASLRTLRLTSRFGSDHVPDPAVQIQRSRMMVFSGTWVVTVVQARPGIEPGGRTRPLFTPRSPGLHTTRRYRGLLVAICLRHSSPLHKSQIADHITLALRTGFGQDSIFPIRATQVNSRQGNIKIPYGSPHYRSGP